MKPFTVLVPCSTSNLGSGFDALGMALSGPDLMVRATPGGERLRITRFSGEGGDRLPLDATNRIIQAAHRAAVEAGRDPATLAADLEVHDLDQLMEKAGLVESIRREANLNGIYSRVADMWHPELRYRAGQPSQRKCAKNCHDHG